MRMSLFFILFWFTASCQSYKWIESTYQETYPGIEHGKVIPFYVGRDIFIEQVRDTFKQKFLEEIEPYITVETYNRINFSKEIIELVENITSKVLKDDPVKVEQLKTSMYLALWATQCTLSFEDFVKRLSRNLI